jgi:hypothetical protein
MSKPFTIIFYCREKCNKIPNRTRVFKYSACINLISRNFELFEVSKVVKIDKDKVFMLAEDFLVTSYPYNKLDAEKWKDASTLQSNAFVRKLGAAIENSIWPSFNY